MRLHRSKIVYAGAAALIVGLALVNCARTPSSDDESARDSESRYNVLLIVSDALRQDAVGCYGGEAATPNIDSLAQSGILFENAYSTSPWTTPSSVSMLAGNYATAYGYSDTSDASVQNMMRVHVPDSELLLMEVLEQSGYRTGAFIENGNVKLHNTLQGTVPMVERRPLREILPPPLVDQITNITGTPLYRTSQYAATFMFIKHLLNLDPQGNFAFLYWILDPHQPYSPMEKFRSKITVDASKLSQPLDHYEGHVLDVKGFTAYDRSYTKALYLGEIESVDERLGCILRVLAHEGLTDNTFVVFTSDHGEQFGDHGLYGHGGSGHNCHYYEGLMRVPLIIAGPGVPKGKRIKANISLIDLMPTLKELLRFEYEDSMQGVSRAPAMLDEPAEVPTLYFDDVREHAQIDALLDGDFKLICLEDGTYELYDLSSDGEELDNIASDYPQKVESMYAEVLRIRSMNNEKQGRNIAALDFESHPLSEEERREIAKQLKSLGYIR